MEDRGVSAFRTSLVSLPVYSMNCLFKRKEGKKEGREEGLKEGRKSCKRRTEGRGVRKEGG